MATTTATGMASSERRASAGRGYWLWGAVVILALLPLLGGKNGIISNYGFLQLSLMIVYAIAVLGLILLTGFNGQISLGHGAFFAVGAYVAAVLIDQANWP
jgi:branched-chain amino acid transport system permease protein